jgi:hypothetical protein
MVGSQAKVIALGLLVGLTVPAEEPPTVRALDGLVTTTAGAELKLRTLWGKPTVLFYEDRHSTQLNDSFKVLLFKKGREQNLLDRASVVAVANLKSFNFFPARQFALAAVRDAEKKAGVPVYVDFKGTLAEAPNALPPNTSSVLVLDAQGRVKFEFHGPLDAAQQEKALAALQAELKAADAP